MSWFKRIFGLKKESHDIKSLESQPAWQSIANGAGAVDGEHYSSHAERVKLLKRENRNQEAITLLLKLVDATEAESKAAGDGWGVAPWYYEQLAIIYRKERLFAEEVKILERFKSQPKSPGARPIKLAERLIKARELAIESKKKKIY